MKSGFLAVVGLNAMLLADPASAQVKIGVLNDQSGLYADYGGKYSVEAAKMAIEDFGGEVLGQKVELVTADHQNKPDLAVAIARRWYDTEGVDMITELTTSSVALAVQALSATLWWAPRPRASRAMPARPTASIGRMTPARLRSAPAARW
jgi:branched-chain amino acid transport system substrate-binding protein